MSTLRGADILVRSLARAGVRHLFALSGNQIMSVFDAALDAKLGIVHTRHEGAAVHMADGWGRMTGEPGIALLTGGPGHANGVGPLATALGAESPLVMLSGHAPLDQLGTDAFQEMRQVEIAKPLCKAAWIAHSAATLGEDIARALLIAKSGRPGPVHVSLPNDVLEHKLAQGEYALPEAAAFVVRPRTLGTAVAHAVLAQLARADRPLIVTGPMMANGRGLALRGALAAATGVPVIFSESPRGLADPTLGALPDVLDQADLVVLLGRKLDYTMCFGRPPLFGAACRFIHIDPDAEALRRSAVAVGDPERMLHAALADALPAAERLTALAQGTFRGAPGLARWAAEVDAALRFRPDWAQFASREAAVHPAAVGRAVARLLDAAPGAVYVSDGGEFAQWSQACASASARMTNGPGGSIGASIPLSVAARLARPDALVVATLGDGSLGYHLAEFETARRCGLPFVAVVGNDACWNAEHQVQLRAYGSERVIGTEMLPARYDLAIAGLGGHAEYVTRAADLDAAFARAAGSGKPACVNIAIARLPALTLSRKAPPPGSAH